MSTYFLCKAEKNVLTGLGWCKVLTHYIIDFICRVRWKAYKPSVWVQRLCKKHLDHVLPSGVVVLLTPYMNPWHHVLKLRPATTVVTLGPKSPALGLHLVKPQPSSVVESAAECLAAAGNRGWLVAFQGPERNLCKAPLSFFLFFFIFRLAVPESIPRKMVV